MPKRGGHTGFTIPNSEFNYAEYRLLEFLTQGEWIFKAGKNCPEMLV
jgi:hypothetical protein